MVGPAIRYGAGTQGSKAFRPTEQSLILTLLSCNARSYSLCSRNRLRLAAVNRNHRPAAADLFPAAAERFIELNQALILVISRLRQREFRLEQGSLAIENVQIVRRTASITH